jgi:hypothetical protein
LTHERTRLVHKVGFIRERKSCSYSSVAEPGNWWLPAQMKAGAFMDTLILGSFYWPWIHACRLSLMSCSVCHLKGETTLRAFCPVADLYDHVFPPQGAELIVLSMGDKILTHLFFRFPDPTSPLSETITQLLLGRGTMTYLSAPS